MVESEFGLVLERCDYCENLVVILIVRLTGVGIQSGVVHVQTLPPGEAVGYINPEPHHGVVLKFEVLLFTLT